MSKKALFSKGRVAGDLFSACLGPQHTKMKTIFTKRFSQKGAWQEIYFVRA
jgi:hypothetical protein